MATRKPMFQTAEAYLEEMAAADDMALGGLAMSGAITMGTSKVTGLGAGSSANDALAYGQSSWSLAAGAFSGAVAMGTNKLTGLSNGTDPADAVNRSQLDQVESASKTWKELLLVQEQILDGASGGVLQAMPLYIDTNPQANDTFLLKNAGLTETYTFKASESIAFDVLIGGSAAATLTNLIAAINDDSAEWGAVATTGLDEYFAGTPTAQGVIYRLTADDDDDRMYSTVAVTSVIKVVEFATGDQDYEKGSGTESTLPSSDPAAKRFGLFRVYANVLQNETHITAEDNATWTWDSDDDAWQQTDASAIVAGAGLSKSAHTINVGDVNRGIQVNTDDLEIDGSEIAGAGLVEASNSWQLDIDLATNPGLEISGGKLQAKPYVAGGIETDANGIGINIEASNPSLQLSGNELGVKFNSSGGLEKGASGTGIKVEANKGLSVGASGLAAVPNTAAGMEVGASGLAVDLEAAGSGEGGLAFDSGEVRINVEANKGLSLGASGLAGVANTAAGLETGASGFGVNLEASNPSLAVVSTELGLKMLSTGGLEKAAGGVNIKIDDTPDTLDVDADGLKVVGVPSMFKIGGTACAASVSAANLLDLTDAGETSLHSHASVPATEAPKVEGTLTTATDTVAVADPVYINGNDTVGKARADDDAKSRLRGVIRTGSGSAPQSVEVVSLGIAAGVLSGATANTAYYLQAAGGIGTSLPAAGSRIIQVGKAENADDLFVSIIDYGKKAA